MKIGVMQHWVRTGTRTAEVELPKKLEGAIDVVIEEWITANIEQLNWEYDEGDDKRGYGDPQWTEI